MRQRRAFRPSVFDRLEDRLVPSPAVSAIAHHVVHASAGRRGTPLVHRAAIHGRAFNSSAGFVPSTGGGFNSANIGGAGPGGAPSTLNSASIASGSARNGFGLENGFSTGGSLAFESGFTSNSGLDVLSFGGFDNGFLTNSRQFVSSASDSQFLSGSNQFNSNANLSLTNINQDVNTSTIAPFGG